MKTSWVAKLLLGAWAVTSGVGCGPRSTTFSGDAQFPGGALGCFNQCRKIGMEMASYVYVGEYSTACACKPKVATGASTSTTSEQQQEIDRDEASVVAATAGVEVQRRRDDADRRRREREKQLR